MDEWTPEAAAMLRRLPAVKVGGYFSTWPKMKVEFSDLVGQAPEPMRLPSPSTAAISRMDAALPWLQWREPLDARIVWMRAAAHGGRKSLWAVGLARAAAHEHWLYGLCVIALHLNRRFALKSVGRRELIGRVRSRR